VADHPALNYPALQLTKAWLENAVTCQPPATPADHAVPPAPQAVETHVLATWLACHETNQQHDEGACQTQTPHTKMGPQKGHPHADEATMLPAAFCQLPLPAGKLLSHASLPAWMPALQPFLQKLQAALYGPLGQPYCYLLEASEAWRQGWAALQHLAHPSSAGPC
jgi:hypothetical protein